MGVVDTYSVFQYKGAAFPISASLQVEAPMASGRRLFTLARLLAVAALLLRPALSSWALPTEGQVAGGGATIKQPTAQSLHIEQVTERALLNWQGFSIGAGETVQFVQPGATSLAVNRVLGGDPSVILGSLLANGRVFLLNPNGIVFGHGSVVNVGGLLATTLTLQDHDLTTGRFSFAQDPAREPAGVVTGGTITAGDHGFVLLAAPGVVNEGLILAKFGQVGLGAGTHLTVDFQGDGLIQYAVSGRVLEQVSDLEGRPLADAVKNAGRIEADGGTVLLTAQASAAVLSSVINQTGVIQARRLESQGGDIVLRGGDEGVVTVAGTLDASGGKGETGATGGTIQVRGDEIVLTETARLDASGDAGGGTITIGGGFQGGGGGPNASAVTVRPGAALAADALTQGDGGLIVVWADGLTRYAGQATARGGPDGGDGGLVEVSGKEHLNFLGTADLRAAQGRVGTLLLDPKFGLIQAGGSDPATGQTFASNPSGTATISGATLGAAINTATVVLQANTDWTIDDNITATTEGNGITTHGLTIQAGRSIIFNANRVLTLNNGPFKAVINDGLATSAQRDAGPAQFVMNGGSQILTNGGTVEIITGFFGFTTVGEVRIGNGTGAATISSLGGNISIKGSGRPGSTSAYGIEVSGGSFIWSTSGQISLAGAGGIGTADNVGVLIRGAGSQITSGAGGTAISINGTGFGTGATSEGIRLEDGARIGDAAAVVGNIALFGVGADQSAGLRTLGPGLVSIGGLQAGNIFLEAGTANAADSIQLANLSVEGLGTLRLGPTTASTTVGINGGPGVYNLNATEMAFFAPGFSFVEIAGTSTVTVNGLTRQESVTLAAQNPGGSVVVTNPITLTGPSSLLQISAGKVLIDSGGNLTTDFGDIVLRGNEFGSSTGNFVGVDINAATVNANGGGVVIEGRGGTTGSDNVGVRLRNDAVIEGTGAVSLTGTGGSGENANDGIRLQGAGTKITTDKPLWMAGEGGLGSGQDNVGIRVIGGAVVESTGNGSAVLDGEGGAGPLATGIRISDAGTMVTVTDGSLTITGQGGGSAGMPGSSAGIVITEGAVVQGTGSAELSLGGAGGAAGTSFNSGVSIEGAGTTVRTEGGLLAIVGSGSGPGTANFGVVIQSGALVESTGAAPLSIIGSGSPDGTSFNHGVAVSGGQVKSAGGEITISGEGGGDGTGSSNVGILAQFGGLIEGIGATPVTLNGMGGAGTNFNHGVALFEGAAQVKSGGGALLISGSADIKGSTGTANMGVYIRDSTVTQTGGTGEVTFIGLGSTTGTSFNHGIALSQNPGNTSKIESAGTGLVSLTGAGGGDGTGGNNAGVLIQLGSQVLATGAASIAISGFGGNGSVNNFGVLVNPSPTLVQTNTGNIVVDLNGTGREPPNANSALIQSTGGGSVTVNP